MEVATREEALAHIATHAIPLSAASICVTHSTDPASIAHWNALDFQYDGMWHFTNQFFMRGLSAYIEGQNFHSYSRWPDTELASLLMRVYFCVD